MKILLLVGSLRKNSWNRKLARVYEELARGTSPQMELVEGKFDSFPLYSEDIQNEGFPPDVLKLGEQIRSAAGVLFVSPEYNYSVPGALKNALDWVSRLPDQPFSGKKCSVIGASPGRLGTARMQYHLRQIGVFLNIQFMNKPEVMVGGVASLFDENGKLLDEGTQKVLRAHLSAFREFVEG